MFGLGSILAKVEDRFHARLYRLYVLNPCTKSTKYHFTPRLFSISTKTDDARAQILSAE